MHTIKLKIHDDIYKHIMFLLNSLDKKKLEIVEEIDETGHLLSSKNNALRLEQSIKELKEGRAKERRLIECE